MGKDREGVFHPKKGKPSGEGHKKGNDIHSETVDQQNRIEDEYGVKEDGTIEANGVHVRHVNRNEDKGRERTTPDSRRGSLERNAIQSNTNKPERDNHVRKSGNARPDFFVLILSKKKAKFFRGDASGLRHIEIEELPNGINDVVHLEEKGDQNLFRQGGSGGAFTGSNFHGLGAGVPDEKQNIVMYLKEVDKTLWTSGLNKSTVPMILGGVEYIVAIYKEITQYKHVMDKSISGSLENEDPKVIYKKAKEIANPIPVEQT
jgi:hypothetical protein